MHLVLVGVVAGTKTVLFIAAGIVINENGIALKKYVYVQRHSRRVLDFIFDRAKMIRK